MNDPIVAAQVKRADLAWWSALSSSADRQAFLQAWVALQASQLADLRHGALILGEPDTGPFEVAAATPAGSRPGPGFYNLVDDCLQGRETAVAADGRALTVAYPIVLGGRLHGVAAFETAPQPPEPVVQALRWGAGVLEAWLLQGERNDSALTIERLMYVVNSVARALKEGRFKDVALTLVTDLATRLECDRVSIGFRQDGRIKVQALSHSSRLVQNMNLVQAVAEAMDEAVDQNTTLCLPQDEGRTIQLRAHHKLAREFGNRHVLTVPFAPDAEARGALLFERPDGRGFDRQDIELCQSVALLAGRVLYQRLRQERPLWRRAATRCCAKRAACSARATSAASCWCWRWRRWRCSPRWPTGPIASARPPPCRAWCSAWSRRRSRAISPRPPAAPATRSGRAMCWPCWIPARPSWSCCAPATWRCSTAARARRPWRAATAPPPPSPRRRRARPWPRSSSTGSRSSVPACARRSTACWSAAT